MADRPKTEVHEVDYEALRGLYPTLDSLAEDGVFPIKREDYLDLYYGPDAPPDVLSAEEELALPIPLRRAEFRDI